MTDTKKRDGSDSLHELVRPKLELTWFCFDCGQKHVLTKGLMGFQIYDGRAEYVGQCENCFKVIEIRI
jgi:hypothetical protein